MAIYFQGRQPKTGRKYSKNKNVSYDEMQSRPAWETEHFQGIYKE